MLRNWLVTALRNFARHRLYIFINITGLAMGLTSAIFIMLFIRDELSFDKWLPNTGDLYRMETTYEFPGATPESTAVGPWLLAPLMKISIPEIRDITRLLHEPMTVKAGDRQFVETAAAVDPNFFRVVPLSLASGDPAKVLANPESVVLSQAMARKYFGDANPLGRTLVLGGSHLLTITGIMRDLPHNTQLDAEIIFSNRSRAENFAYKNDWFGGDAYTYMRLLPGADPATVVQKTEAVLDRSADMSALLRMRIPAHKVIQVHLTRFEDVHMNPFPFDVKPGGSWIAVYGFGAIAALIVLIACFNFMNLATARAMQRAREVGLRKVVGAKRRQLIAQFLAESVGTALIALVVASAAVEILSPAYDNFINRPITFDFAGDWIFTFGVVGVAVIAGLLGGIYPALVISGFRPVAVLKPAATGQGGTGWLRNSLVVLQFAISIGLGIVMLTVRAQIVYSQKVDLGFDRENIVLLKNAEHLTAAARDAMTDALAHDPDIAAAAQSASAPFGEGAYTGGLLGIPGNPRQFGARSMIVAPDYFRVYKIALVAGRNLSLRPADIAPADARTPGRFNILLNETAVKSFGFTNRTVIGKVLTAQHAQVTVVGVVGDAKYDATRDQVGATYYYDRPGDMQLISVRIKPGGTVEAIAAVDRIWRRFAPTEAVDRHFLDDSFDRLYASDRQIAALFGLFVAIAIFIACLGLFGLAAFSAERRTREIGVRKVFGARTGDVVRLLVWQFSIPVLIANAIAWPVAWYYLHNWLESYAYRITLSPLYFLAAGAAALVIAWLTVIGHSLAVARANPVHALRYE